MLTPAQATRERLSTRLVHEEFNETRASTIIQALLRQYADDIPVLVVNGALIADPLMDVRYPYIPLWDAIGKICQMCDARMIVDKTGTLIIRGYTPDEMLARQEAIRSGLIENAWEMEPVDAADIDGVTLAIGDVIEIAHMDDPDYAFLVGVRGVVDFLANDDLSLSAVLEHTDIPLISTFNSWVRKVTPEGKATNVG